MASQDLSVERKKSKAKARAAKPLRAAKAALKKKRAKRKAAPRAERAKPSVLKAKNQTKNKKEVVAAKPEQELPEYLKTPSAETFRNFRKAAERSRKQAEKSKRKAKGNFLAKPSKKGKMYSLDLRIHSPGTVGYFSTGGVDPGPALVRLAAVKGLDLIGVTDYYNASYVDLVRASAEKTNLTILPGVVLCAAVGVCQEVYMIALFPESYSSAEIFHVLNELGVPKAAHGRRDYCLTMPVKKIISIIEMHGGILIPSRLDKTPYRQLAIPTLVEEFGIHAFDLVHPENTSFFEERWPDGEFTFFSFSNANSLAQIGTREGKVKLSDGSFAGIAELVKRRDQEALVSNVDSNQ